MNTEDELFRRRLAFFGLELTEDGQYRHTRGDKNSAWSLGSFTTDIHDTESEDSMTQHITVDGREITKDNFAEQARRFVAAQGATNGDATKDGKRGKKGTAMQHSNGHTQHTETVVYQPIPLTNKQAKKAKAHEKMMKTLARDLRESRTLKAKAVNGAVIAAGVTVGVVTGGLILRATTSNS